MDHSRALSPPSGPDVATEPDPTESRATDRLLLGEARLDPAHNGSSTSRLDDGEASQESADLEVVPDWFERQAGELAEYLRDWQRDLDRRERRIHQQIVALDLERRSFRLWMQQVECDLEARRRMIELQAATSVDPFEYPHEGAH